MRQFGFEQEFFIRNTAGDLVLAPKNLINVGLDECGYLVEGRGKPHDHPILAAYSLLAANHLMQAALSGAKNPLILVKDLAFTKIPAVLQRKAIRRDGKHSYPENRGNLYGKDYSPSDRWQRAGLHVHFSDFEKTRVFGRTGQSTRSGHHMFQIHRPLDMPRIILALDKAFKEEIKAAKRLLGMYEMKPYGFEYRSLPTTVNVLDVAEFIADM